MVWSDAGPPDLHTRVVLYVLARHMDPQGGCWPSVPRVARLACMSVRRAQQALALAVQLGWVRRVDETGRVSHYEASRPTGQTDLFPAADRPARRAPAQGVHPGTACTTPPQDVHRPPQGVHHTPARPADELLQRTPPRTPPGNEEPAPPPPVPAAEPGTSHVATERTGPDVSSHFIATRAAFGRLVELHAEQGVRVHGHVGKAEAAWLQIHERPNPPAFEVVRAALVRDIGRWRALKPDELHFRKRFENWVREREWERQEDAPPDADAARAERKRRDEAQAEADRAAFRAGRAARGLAAVADIDPIGGTRA